MNSTLEVSFKINGRPMRMTTAVNRVLADVLREDLGLTGTKISCDQNVCGACTLLVDGQPTASCSTFMFEVDGTDITTVEGLQSSDGVMSDLQVAFARAVRSSAVSAVPEC